MDWYYALNNQQQGPVSGDQLRALLQNGTISPASLVWREGMASWQPYASVATELGDGASAAPDSRTSTEAAPAPAPLSAGPAAEIATCAYSGEVLPRSEMIQYGDKWVAVRHKDAFIQALQAGREIGGGGAAGAMVYAGFWWRVLASVIDGLVKFVANIVFSIPQYIVMFSGGGAPIVTNPESIEDFIMAGGLAYQLTTLFAWLAGIAFSMAYETWMVGRYGATVGKLALNLQIVNPDGSSLTYLKAFGRWWGETLTKTIWYLVIGIGVAVVIATMGLNFFSAFEGNADPEEVGRALASGFGVLFLVLLVTVPLGGFGYWMAGLSREKKALHDILCNTRVIRKPGV